MAGLDWPGQGQDWWYDRIWSAISWHVADVSDVSDATQIQYHISHEACKRFLEAFYFFFSDKSANINNGFHFSSFFVLVWFFVNVVIKINGTFCVNKNQR